VSAAPLVGECEHHELIGMPCPPCDKARGRVFAPLDCADEPGEWSLPFHAGQHGWCRGCQLDVNQGELICGRDRVDGFGREYRHAGLCLKDAP
jgi:hypothetical protein